MDILIKTLCHNQANKLQVIAITEFNGVLGEWEVGRLKTPKLKLQAVREIENFKSRMEGKGYRVAYSQRAMEYITDIYLAQF